MPPRRPAGHIKFGGDAMRGERGTTLSTQKGDRDKNEAGVNVAVIRRDDIGITACVVHGK